MKTAPVRVAAYLLPYAAVLVGMYVLFHAWTAIVAYHLGIALIAAIDRERFFLRKLTRGWNKELAPGFILLGASSGLVLLAIWPWLGLDYRLPAGLAYVGLSGFGYKAFLLYFGLVNPPVEELLWRGYLARERPLPDFRDLLFAGYHGLVLQFFLEAIWVIVAVVVLFLVAWSWRMVTLRTGGLLLPMLSHLAAAVALATVLWIRTPH